MCEWVSIRTICLWFYTISISQRYLIPRPACPLVCFLRCFITAGSHLRSCQIHDHLHHPTTNSIDRDRRFKSFTCCRRSDQMILVLLFEVIIKFLNLEICYGYYRDRIWLFKRLIVSYSDRNVTQCTLSIRLNMEMDRKKWSHRCIENCNEIWMFCSDVSRSDRCIKFSSCTFVRMVSEWCIENVPESILGNTTSSYWTDYMFVHVKFK